MALSPLTSPLGASLVARRFRLLGVWLCALLAPLWVWPASADAPRDEVRWSRDGSIIIHRRLPPKAGAKSPASEFIYDPTGDARDAVRLPREIRRGARSFAAPSSSVAPGAGEPVHTRDGLTPSSLSAVGSPASPEMDPRLSFAERTAPDRVTQKEGSLHYRSVFDPSVVPFKRNRSLNAVSADYSLRLTRGEMQPVDVVGNRVVDGREVFWASLLLDGGAGEWIAIPSVSPDTQILSARSTPAMPLAFRRDGADNLYVRTTVKGPFRLVMVVDGASRYFGRELPQGMALKDLPPPRSGPLPSNVKADARRFNNRLRLNRSSDFAQAVTTLRSYFRSFSPGSPPEPKHSIFLDLALGKKGICRHRSFAFVIAARGLGIDARYVMNEAHIFVEVWVPGSDPGWLRIDLGGGADELVIHQGRDKGRHRPQNPDPFASPDPTVGERAGLAGAMRVVGLPPAQGPDLSPGLSAEPGTGEDAHLRALAARVIAQPRAASGATPTRTTLELSTQFVFRGEPFEARGRVVTAEGAAVGGGQVQIVLIDAHTRKPIQQVALVAVNAQGHFEAPVTLGRHARPGAFECVAQFLGTKQHAPSTSP